MFKGMFQPTELIRPAIACGLLLALVLAGCTGVELHRFKEHAAQDDYQWIAGRTIGCDNASDTCGQLHLIKGEACFRLARSGQAPAHHYHCAADELAKGLALKRSWTDPNERQHFQEHLCESLANLHTLQSGEAAGHTLVRLVDAAEALYRMAPESVPAIYYLAIAQFRKMQPKLTHLAVFERMPVCIRLKRTLMTVLTAMETARVEGSEDWKRYAKNYERLSFELGSAIGAANCQ